ncbi:MAG TPA: Rieske 2Fe-2S domain-containing protein [Gemmatimonadales bacterium]|jgi:nitrite reductase/ring-hydroxylating ferredoxin subunit/multimeric flavodoxin WrbA
MATWHRLGTRDELARRAPFALKLDRQQIAVFYLEGSFHAIGNRCNHRGGPLAEGLVRGEYVMCPWHAWEYSIVSGKGPPGYEGESIPVFALEERGDGIYLNSEPVSPRRLVRHEPHPLAVLTPRPAGAATRVLGISTTAMDQVNPRFSTSDHLLEAAMAHAGGPLGAETRLIRLRDLQFRACEGNYSKAAHACTWPCAITERDPADQLTPVYEGLVQWADVVLVATPIRWGEASSLYHRMAERLNCIQNQITCYNRCLISRKVAAFIVTGGQDNVQAVVGHLLTFWAELGFLFPQFPFIAHSRGWDAEDMETNVRVVRDSTTLVTAAAELLERAVDLSRVLERHRPELEKPMERSGRKAQRLGEVAAAPE